MDIPYSAIAPFEPLGLPTLERTLTLKELSKLLVEHQCDYEYKDGTLVIMIPCDSPYAKYIR